MGPFTSESQNVNGVVISIAQDHFNYFSIATDSQFILSMCCHGSIECEVSARSRWIIALCGQDGNCIMYPSKL